MSPRRIFTRLGVIILVPLLAAVLAMFTVVLVVLLTLIGAIGGVAETLHTSLPDILAGFRDLIGVYVRRWREA